MHHQPAGETVRTRLALGLGKVSRACLRLIRRLNFPCDGTSFPGRIMLTVDSKIMAPLSRRCQGLILVTGTNGKTSTTALLVKLLQKSGYNVISNSEGANMVPGLATALLAAKPFPAAAAKDNRLQVAVLEVDEGSLTPLAQLLPRVDLIVVTNLFPDQVDRYGSVQALARQMKKALAAWPNATLLLNANDPVLASWGQNRPRCRFFAVSTSATGNRDPDSEGSLCPFCQQVLHYNSIHYAQLGIYSCPRCGFRPPPAQVSVQPSRAGIESGTALLVRTPTEKIQLISPLAGLYNVYNAAAALAAAVSWQPTISLRSLGPALASFQAPAGRSEYFRWPQLEKKAALALVKNPTGFNQALATFLAQPDLFPPLTLVIAINDLPADGRDVSWLKDIYLENIPLGTRVICSGRRAWAIANRFKDNLVPAQISVESNVRKAVRAALQTPAANLIMLCNYTVLSPLRTAVLKEGGETFTASPVVRK